MTQAQAQAHAQTALDLLNAADVDFIALDDRKGSEKLCAAAESALTAVAQKMGWEEEDLSSVAARISEEHADPRVQSGFSILDLFRLNVELGVFDEFALDMNLPAARYMIRRAVSLASDDDDGADADAAAHPTLAPRDRARIALRLLSAAEREFADGDNRKGSEKISAAAEHAIVAVAKAIGLPSDTPEDLNAVVRRVKSESEDAAATLGFAAIELFRLNAKLNALDETAIELSVPAARDFTHRMIALASESETAK